MMSAEIKTAQVVSFTYCKNFASAETKSATWAQFANSVTKSIAYGSKEESIKRAMIIGGVREDEARGRADNVKTREIATLDYDNLAGLTLSDIELALELYMPKTSWLAYSTFRHTPESPRVRIMFPLSRTVSAPEYSAIVNSVVDALDLGPADPCSYTVSQGMFLASHQVGVDPWSAQGGSGALDVDKMGLIIKAQPETDVFDLDLVVASQPLDITSDDVATLLENYPAEACDYNEWFRVGMALHHQYEGSDAGLAIWDAWCAVDADRYKPTELPKKWRSFGGSASPVTMASVIKAAGGLTGGAVAVSPGGDVAQSLEDQAGAISTMAEYAAFKKRIVAMSAVQMPPDIRSMLATIAHEVFAKAAGMGLREVKASFKPAKTGAGADNDGATEKTDAPEWLENWCYYTADNVFIDASNPALAIDGRGFDAKFAGESEPRAAEIRPSDFALNHVIIPTVDRLFFMPDTSERFCERNGFDALNTYRRGGVTPCETLDADGQGVVDLFLSHIAWTFPDKAHQTLILDWMAHVYQNPGQRVNWALLIWGIQGSGKTLLFNILQRLIGSQNSKDVSPSSLKGDFNDWAVGGIIGCIEEIRLAGQNKWAIMDVMKPAITNDLLAINPKGKTSYSAAPNFCSYLMLTNHQDAIPVSDGDRRFCVLFSAHHTKEDLEADHGGAQGLSDYFKRLFDGCVNRRPDAMARFLTDYDISADFDHKGRAPRTGGFDEMIEANRSDEENTVRELITDHGSPILSNDIICVTELKAQAMLAEGAELPTSKRLLGQLLREMGYQPVGTKVFRVLGTKHYVWVKSRKISDDEAKNRVREFYAPSDEFADVPF